MLRSRQPNPFARPSYCIQKDGQVEKLQAVVKPLTEVLLGFSSLTYSRRTPPLRIR
jgi:hypothetical protein